jgi:predicted RNA-binding protein (TIGR00451 family)
MHYQIVVNNLDSIAYSCRIPKGENMPDKAEDLWKIRCIADYQFGRGVGNILFPDNVDIFYSKRTGRIRHVYLDSKILVTLRPRDGFFSLTIFGAKRIVEGAKPLHYCVKVQDDVSDFIAEGRSVFAKHVVDADEEIRPMEEVIVINGKGEVLAVGKAVLTGKEMTAFKKGVAVKVRRGAAEES